jgi:hypothetical protein
VPIKAFVKRFFAILFLLSQHLLAATPQLNWAVQLGTNYSTVGLSHDGTVFFGRSLPYSGLWQPSGFDIGRITPNGIISILETRGVILDSFSQVRLALTGLTVDPSGQLYIGSASNFTHIIPGRIDWEDGTLEKYPGVVLSKTRVSNGEARFSNLKIEKDGGLTYIFAGRSLGHLGPDGISQYSFALPIYNVAPAPDFFRTYWIGSSTNSQWFWMRIQPSGSILATGRFGLTSIDGSPIIAPGPDGIYFSGIRSAGSSTFGSIQLTSTDNGSYIAKMGLDGKFLWAKHLSNFQIGKLQADPEGGFFAAGTFAGKGVIISQFDSNGTTLWESSSIGKDGDSLYDLVLSGNRLVAYAKLAPPGTISGTNLNLTLAENCLANFSIPRAPSLTAISINAPATIVKADRSFSFDALALGTPPLKFQWIKNGSPVLGETNISFSRAAASLSDEAAYQVIAFNAAGSITSGPIHLDIIQELKLTKALKPRTVAENSIELLDVDFVGRLPVAIEWRHNGEVIPNLTSKSWTIPAVHPEDIGTYTVILSDAERRITNSAILDIMWPYPEPKIVSVSTVKLPPPPPPSSGYQLYLPSYGSFRSGTIVGNEWATDRTPSPPWFYWTYLKMIAFDLLGAPKWTTNAVLNGLGFSGWTPLFTVDDKLLLSTPISGEYKLFGIILSPASKQAFTSLSADGVVAWQTSIPFSAAWPYTLFHDSAGNWVPRLSGGAAILNNNGQTIFTRILPPGFEAIGRTFGISSAGSAYIPELDYQPKTSSSGLVGKLAETGEIAWIAEIAELSEFYAANGMDDVLASTGNDLKKILRDGSKAWTVRVTGNVEVTSADHARFVGISTNTLQFGDWISPDDQTNSLYIADIDPAGIVRVATRLPCSGLGEISAPLAPEGNGIYRFMTLAATNSVVGDFNPSITTNGAVIVRLWLPEPNEPGTAEPEITRTVSAGASTSITAVPNLIGAVAYQWLLAGRPLSSQRSQTLEFPNFSVADAGQYSLIVRNAYISVTNRVATLKYSGPPALAVRNDGGNVLIIWPIANSAMKLQETSNLNVPFSNVSGTPVMNSALARMEIALPQSSAQRFFRLFQP